MARRAIVTGGSRGIGRRIAEVLAADGTQVLLTYRRNEADARAVVDGIVRRGGVAEAARVELESSEDIDALFAEHFAGHDGLDVLVANAAASAFKPIEQFGPHHLERSWATNVRSFVQLAQRAVPLMRDGGRIIAITSYGSLRAFPHYGAIGADKAALESWVRHMAAEFGPRGITVNAVNGGVFDTDSSRHYYGVDGIPPIETVRDAIPLRRLGTVDDLAGLVGFLAGEGGAYITGQTIVVDGGLTVVAPPFLP